MVVSKKPVKAANIKYDATGNKKPAAQRPFAKQSKREQTVSAVGNKLAPKRLPKGRA